MNRRPLTGRFDVAIIPCGGAKHPPSPYGPYKAALLYKGTPFRKNLEHAQIFAERVLILSAKYGLVDLDDKIEWYEAYLPDLDVRERWILHNRIKDQYIFKHLNRMHATGGQFVSYLPKAYQEALDAALPWLQPSRPYAGLTMLQMIKRLNQETRDAQRSVGR